MDDSFRNLILSLALALLLAPGSLPVEAKVPTEPDAGSLPLGAFIEGIACEHDASQTYSLYLHSTYTEEGRSPVLFVFDPRGRSVMAGEIFRDAAERYGWIILSSDNTRSDGPWEPNAKAVYAMWPELRRYAIDPQRIYATGFSGGAMVAWWVGQLTGALAGVISSGSRPMDDANPDIVVPFAHFGAAGEGEFNYQPTRDLDAIAARAGAPHRFEAFEGPHRWMPPAMALEAIEWMELQAMRKGSRQKEEGLVGELFEKDLGKAEALESRGRALEAQRRFEAVAQTFEGLLDTQEIRRKAASLAQSAALKKAVKHEKAAHHYELIQLSLMRNAIDQLKNSDTQISVNRLANDVRLTAMLQTAQDNSYEGLAAQRVLNSLNSFLSFYLPRDYLAAKEFRRAAVVLELATRIDDDRPIVWYNLACAWAQTGKTDQAMEALSRSVDVGYRQLDNFESDTDLDPLRNLPGFPKIADRIRRASELAAEPPVAND